MEKHEDQTKVKKTLFPALVLAFSMIFLNATFLPIALPAISKSLNIDTSSLFWVVNAYFITTGTLLLLGGRLVKRYGPLKLFKLGISLYVLGSITAFLSVHFTSLLFARVICGMGGAFISPATFSVIVHVYKESVRGKKIGTLIGMSSVALMIGPFAGGALTQLFSWRALFLLNVLVGCVAFLLSMRSQVHFTKHREGFDIAGFCCFSVAVASLVYGITLLGAHGFSLSNMAPIGLAFLLSLGLVLLSRQKHPYFDLSLFKGHAFLLAIVLVFFCQGILSLTFFWPAYFLTQGGMGATPIAVGSAISFTTLGIFIFSPIAGVYFDRRGVKKPMLIGWSLLSISLLGVAITLLYPHFGLFLFFFSMFGIGIAFISTPLGTLSQMGAEKSTSGMIAGLYNTVRFVSSALGVALLSSLGTRLHRQAFFKLLPARFDFKGLSFEAISKAKIGGLFFKEFGAKYSKEKLEMISKLWDMAYQKSFFMMHMGLFAIALTVLCIVVVCRKKTFITKLSK